MNELHKFLVERARESKLTFAEFMADALYHPKWGYYAANPARTGPAGDFITSPTISPVFGRTVARLVIAADGFLNEPDRFTVLEPAAGRGDAAEAILEYVKKNRPALFERIEYIVVEKSFAAREFLKNRFADASKVRIIDDLADIEPIIGLIWSNELFDAFPVNRLVVRDGSVKEIYIGAKEGELIEVEDNVSDTSLIELFAKYLPDLSNGQIIDVSAAWKLTAESLAGKIAEGLTLALDYGYAARDLYSPMRMKGTLLAYSRHRTSERFFDNPGEVDLTAHVDFTAIAEAGESAGLKTFAFTDQLRLFLDLGVHEVLQEFEQEIGDFAKFRVILQDAKRLIMPSDMGETFKALVQGKGLSGEAESSLRMLIRSKYHIYPD